MGRPRRQLKNAVLVDAGQRIEAVQMWYTQSALARHLGRSRTWVYDQAKIRPLYAPVRTIADGMLYHAAQVALMDAVIAGNTTEDAAVVAWEMKRKLIGIQEPAHAS